MSNYYRITAYHKGINKCCIIDSNGIFEKQFQFTYYLYDKGFEIIEVGDTSKFLDVNIGLTEPNPEKMILRAEMYGRPVETTATVRGVTYRAIMVEDKVYIPNRFARV